MTIDELHEAVDFIAVHNREDSVSLCGDEFLVSAVRRALGMTVHYRRWEDEKEKVRDLIDQGLSIPEIAREMGVDRSTVCDRCRKWGFESKRRRFEYTKITEMRMADYRRKGRSIQSIADEIGISYEQCKKKLQHMGVVLTTEMKSRVIADSNRRRKGKRRRNSAA